MNVLITDNYPLSRLGLNSILSSHFPGIHIEEADSATVLSKMSSGKFDLVILALSHPGKNSLSLLTKIKSACQAPVLVTCIYPEEIYALRALKIGAAGYLCREAAIADFLKVVKKIVGGGIYVSPTLAESMAGKLDKNFKKAPHELLSDRELQILQLMAAGKKAQTISRETSLSVNTISTYRSRILQKLGFKTNAEITRFAIENSLV